MKSAFATSVVIISWNFMVVNRLCKFLLKSKVKGILPRTDTKIHEKGRTAPNPLPREGVACDCFCRKTG